MLRPSVFEDARLFEVGLHASIIEPTNCVVDRRSATNSAETVRRLGVGEVIHAHVEVVLGSDVDPQAHVMIEARRPPFLVREIGIFRRTTLEAVRGLIVPTVILPMYRIW